MGSNIPYIIYRLKAGGYEFTQTKEGFQLLIPFFTFLSQELIIIRTNLMFGWSESKGDVKRR